MAMTPEQKAARRHEREERDRKAFEEAEQRREARRAWVEIEPDDPVIADALKLADLVQRAWYGTPASRLRLENIVLRARLAATEQECETT